MSELAAVEAEQQQLEAEAKPPDADIDAGSVLPAIRAIGDARSLSDALATLVQGAAAAAPRAAVLIVNGNRLEEWPVAGIPAISHQPVELDRAGLIRAAVTRGTRVASAVGDEERMPPPFGLLPAMRASRPDPWTTLKDTVGALAGSGGSLFLRKGLVTAQVALSFLLLFAIPVITVALFLASTTFLVPFLANFEFFVAAMLITIGGFGLAWEYGLHKRVAAVLRNRGVVHEHPHDHSHERQPV